MLYWLNALLLLFITAGAAQASAVDDGLYAPPPPAGAAWVRVLGGSTVQLGEHILSGPAYEMVMQGNYTLSHRSTAQMVQIEAGKHYSFSTYTAQPQLLTDPQLENRARALLVLYNFSDRLALDLITADGQLKVIENVSVQANGSRMVQPINVRLAVSANGEVLKELQEVQLQRSVSYSVVVSGAAANITAELIEENTTKEAN